MAIRPTDTCTPRRHRSDRLNGILSNMHNQMQVHDSILALQVSIERTLGTVIGGVLGYFAVIINRSITLTDDVIFGPLSAAAVAVIGVVVGRALKLEYSSRLFCMTYILVLMGAEVASGALPALSQTDCNLKTQTLLASSMVNRLMRLACNKSAQCSCSEAYLRITVTISMGTGLAS